MAVVVSSSTIYKGKIIGMGRTARVIQTGDQVIKISIALDFTGQAEEFHKDLSRLNDEGQSALENEKQILSVLGNHDGIVPWYSISESGIEMEYMKNGDLHQYLKRHEPDRALMDRWIRQLVQSIAYVHSRGIVISDIASRNVLLSEDLSLVLCDFGEANMLASDESFPPVSMYSMDEMKGDLVEENNRWEGINSEADQPESSQPSESGKMDHVREGAFKEDDGFLSDQVASIAFTFRWPRLEEPPDIKGLPYESVIRGCWEEQGFSLMPEVLEAVDL
ncbi:MAG: hypothetical protein M1818_000061 [Claussenomyces sp. TS43310]|nr:MAG: hypothetical protein M1818_000061 [Claussenomyces sp. TS43310]